jgi:putative acetyltransferase
MKIREYTFEDAEAHAEVHRQSVRGIASEDYSDEVIEAWSAKEPEDSPIEEEKVRFVAEEDGEIVGFSDYNMETKELSGLYVKPGYTGRGIGEKLLEKAEKDAKKNDLERLWCKSTITAKEFYQRHGYEIVEETNHQIEGLNMKVYRMEKDLV